jgi:transcriptional regulator with XRE-family HTH domain
MPAGRPSRYDGSAKSLRLIEKRAALGLTMKELAEELGICEASLKNWKNEHPELLAAIRRGTMKANEEVAGAVFTSAKGYHKKVEKAIPGIGIEKVNEYYPPNIHAARYYLSNRDPSRWREKNFVEHEGSAPILNITVSSDQVKKNIEDDIKELSE